MPPVQRHDRRPRRARHRGDQRGGLGAVEIGVGRESRAPAPSRAARAASTVASCPSNAAATPAAASARTVSSRPAAPGRARGCWPATRRRRDRAATPHAPGRTAKRSPRRRRRARRQRPFEVHEAHVPVEQRARRRTATRPASRRAADRPPPPRAAAPPRRSPTSVTAVSATDAPSARTMLQSTERWSFSSSAWSPASASPRTRCGTRRAKTRARR